MSTVETASAATEVKKPKAKKPKAKKPATKKATKKAKKPRESHGFRWTEKRAKAVRALIALHATAATKAVDAETIAKKSGLSLADVKHYLYKENDLVTSGHAGITKRDGSILLLYYVTAKGANADTSC